MNIYLIGMRAVGKSSVGQRVAAQLRRPFIDMDRVLASEFKQSISAYVDLNGWQAFRQKEAALLERIGKKKGLVVATGGGVISNENNIARMRASGRVVWLKAGLDTLKQRLVKDASSSEMRPPLGSMCDAASELETLLRSREGVYRSAMHFEIDTEEYAVDTISRRIIARYACEFKKVEERLRNCHGRQ